MRGSANVCSIFDVIHPCKRILLDTHYSAVGHYKLV